MMKCIFVILSISVACIFAQNITDSTPPPRPKIFEVTFPETDSQSECSIRFNKFQGAYLRGVKSPNLISFNQTTFSGCQKRCCYEESFVCQSFSYFTPLRQCFIMNLTKHHSKVELINVPGYVHVQLVEFVEETTAFPDTTTVLDEETTVTTTVLDEETAVTTAVEEDTEKTTEPEFWSGTTASSNKSDSNAEGSGFIVVPGNEDGVEAAETSTSATTSSKTRKPGSDSGVLEETESPEKMISDRCPLTCENDGKCELRAKGNGSSGEEAFCECVKGFEGNTCEDTVTEEDGFPVWIIIIIVIGALIVILVIVLCVMLQVYKKKKGEYKVVYNIRRWARRGKKPKNSDVPDEPAHIEEGNATSPTTSVQSIQNSDTSASTKTAI